MQSVTAARCQCIAPLPLQLSIILEEVANYEKGGGRKFSEFYEKWMVQLEDILHQLLKAINSNKHHQNGNQSSEISTTSTEDNVDEQLESLVSKVTTHQKQYYAAKWAAAHEDVLAFYAPSWLSPLEIAYSWSWVTGWKPSMAFRVLDSLRKRAGTEWPEGDNEKTRKMGELRVKIRLEEEKVERQMERQQVAMVDWRMVELVRLASRRCEDAEDNKRIEEMVEVALRGLKNGLEKVMKAADCVRLKTLKGVLDILTPKSKQCVEFLAAALLLQIQLRKWGCGKDQIQTSTVNGST
ncbi:unnamed protein product [Rhodiola kirilowii]